MEDIQGRPLAAGVVNEIKEIVKFFRIHGRLYAELKRKVGKQLLLPADTRFKTVNIMLGRALEVSLGLQQTCFSEPFVALMNSTMPTKRQRAETVKDSCLAT